MEGVWELPEDESEFIQVVDKALAYGPLILSKDGREVAVVISMEEYRRMKQRQSLGEFFRLLPSRGWKSWTSNATKPLSKHVSSFSVKL